MKKVDLIGMSVEELIELSEEARRIACGIVAVRRAELAQVTNAIKGLHKSGEAKKHGGRHNAMWTVGRGKP